jgi:hypothetical protein
MGPHCRLQECSAIRERSLSVSCLAALRASRAHFGSLRPISPPRASSAALAAVNAKAPRFAHSDRIAAAAAKNHAELSCAAAEGLTRVAGKQASDVTRCASSSTRADVLQLATMSKGAPNVCRRTSGARRVCRLREGGQRGSLDLNLPI